MFERVLVPLDGSQLGGRALPYAIEIAKRFGGEVMLLQIIHPVEFTVLPVRGKARTRPATAQSIIEPAEALDKRNLARAKRYLGKKCKEVTAQGATGSYYAVLGDLLRNPAKDIIRFCRKESVDLVVMTTSGKSSVKRALLGSVTDEVIREAGLPVLAIRPQRQRTKK